MWPTSMNKYTKRRLANALRKRVGPWSNDWSDDMLLEMYENTYALSSVALGLAITDFKTTVRKAFAAIIHFLSKIIDKLNKLFR